jgi:AbrB family looped-hinge helix DNA binding protein
MDDTSTRIHRLKVDAAGRVVLPAELRQRHHIQRGDEVVAEEDDQGIRLRTRDQILREVQAYFSRFATPGVGVVDELIRERREEAARE